MWESGGQMDVNIPKEQVGIRRAPVSGLQFLKAGLSPGLAFPVSGTHPRCSVCPSAWKSTSCPFWSCPTAVLADITFTNLLKEPVREEAWLITSPSGKPPGLCLSFLAVRCPSNVSLRFAFPASRLPHPTQFPHSSQTALLRYKLSDIGLQGKSL